MATTTDRTAYASNPTAGSAGKNAVSVLLYTHNAATYTRGAGDLDNIFNVYAGDTVLSVTAEVITAEGATCTFSVGDGDSATGYINAADANTTGWKVQGKALTEGTPNTLTGFWPMKTYTADDTIDVTWNTASTDACKVKFRAIVIRADSSDSDVV